MSLRGTRICAGSPPVVPIAGEIDESSYSGLVSTLEGLADREGDVHVNLAEVAFCDLAGLRAVLWLASRKLPLRARRRPSVVCAARTLPPRRIAAEGPGTPGHLLLEGILDVLASVLETSLSLVSMSLGLQGLISGGLARTETILQTLSDELGLPCEIWDPLETCEVALPPAKRQALPSEFVSLNVACGAAFEYLRN